MDTLYGKITAIEIVMEEIFAELMRKSPQSDQSLALIVTRATGVAEKLKNSGQYTATVTTTTAESIARIGINLSRALAGDLRPRSRGA